MSNSIRSRFCIISQAHAFNFLQLKKFKEDFDQFDADMSDDINAKEMQVRGQSVLLLYRRLKSKRCLEIFD